MSVQMHNQTAGLKLPTRKKRSLLSASFRYIEEVMRELKSISEDIDALSQIARQQRRAIAKVFEIAGGEEVVFTLKPTKTPQTTDPFGKKKSATPKGYKDITVEKMAELQKNYAVVQELYRKFYDLQDMESELEMKFSGMDTSKATAEIARLRLRVQNALDDAFKFLQEVSMKHVPRRLEKFCTRLAEVLAHGLNYQELLQYLYIYTLDGDVVFSHYFHLKNVTDEANKFFTSKFVIISMKAEDEDKFYVTLHHEFEPPGQFQIGRGVANLQQAVTALDMMLLQDRFETSLGHLPVNQILNPESVKKERFTYKDSIQKIAARDNELEFVIDPSVTDTHMINSIFNSLHQEMRALVLKRGTEIRAELRKKGNKRSIVFYFKREDGRPAVPKDELEFLQDRYQLSDDSLDRIARIINQSQGQPND